jgi:predicted transcriptional regulator
MPKRQTAHEVKQESEFNKEAWLGAVKERIMKEAWGSGRLWTDGIITMEVVRVGESEDIMVRIRTPLIRNTIKLTKKEHINSFIELANAVVKNENNLRDKLEALKELLKSRPPAGEEEL